MSLSYKTTHVAEAKARLLQQFKAKAKLEGGIAARAQQTQELEDALWQVHTLLDLDTASGLQLDGLGGIVGRERGPLIVDSVYATILAVQVLINRTDASADTLMQILELLVANDYTYTELYPAAFRFVLDGSLSFDAALLASLLGDARGGGIGGALWYQTVADGDAFTFADGDVVQVDADRGFADETPGVSYEFNGTFSTWTGDNPNSWTVVEDGVQTQVTQHPAFQANLISLDGSEVKLSQVVTGLVVGNQYAVKIDVNVINGGSVRVGGDDIPTTTLTTTGTHIFYFEATAITSEIWADNNGLVMDVEIDNFRLHSWPGGRFAGVEVI